MIFQKQLRLPFWDYSREGIYFLTLCTYQRKCLFGEVIHGHMVLNRCGYIVKKTWRELKKYYPQISLDTFTVMPNHVHGIIFVRNKQVSPVEAIHELPLDNVNPSNTAAIHELRLRDNGEYEHKSLSKRRKMLIPKIIGRFKMQSAKIINCIRKTPALPVWQRNYHDHILRSEQDLNNAREYIIHNPQNWRFDRNNPLSQKSLNHR